MQKKKSLTWSAGGEGARLLINQPFSCFPCLWVYSSVFLFCLVILPSAGSLSLCFRLPFWFPLFLFSSSPCVVRLWFSAPPPLLLRLFSEFCFSLCSLLLFSLPVLFVFPLLRFVPCPPVFVCLLLWFSGPPVRGFFFARLLWFFPLVFFLSSPWFCYSSSVFFIFFFACPAFPLGSLFPVFLQSFLFVSFGSLSLLSVLLLFSSFFSLVSFFPSPVVSPVFPPFSPIPPCPLFLHTFVPHHREARTPLFLWAETGAKNLLPSV